MGIKMNSSGNGWGWNRYQFEGVPVPEADRGGDVYYEWLLRECAFFVLDKTWTAQHEPNEAWIVTEVRTPAGQVIHRPAVRVRFRDMERLVYKYQHKCSTQIHLSRNQMRRVWNS